MIRRLMLCVAALLFAAASLPAQTAIPTPDEFLGYAAGEQFTPYDRVLDYFRELTKRSNLISMQQFGQTYEGRPLVVATITSAKNRAALEQLRRDVASLADPAATTDTHAAEIVRNAPAVVWLGFGVHGNESSSTEAAMQIASTLLRDPQSATILDNTIVLIDPLQNPDGRERYVQGYKRIRGMQADPNPEAFEHNEGWPGGRANHYLVDMNRDWTWTSQQETRARVALYRQWNPQVFVDFHEMGSESTYFFPPDATPINTNVPKDVEKWLEVFGRANAEAFSRNSWAFYVAERFDLFYPGYGDSWPSLHGAVGMTYEVAGGGRAGSAITRDDGSVLTLADRIARHYTTGMATLRTAAAHRADLLDYTWRAMKAEQGANQNTFFVLPTSPNFYELLDTLNRQAIHISILNAALNVKATRVDTDVAESRTLPAGTAMISTHQPLGGLVQTLMERTPVFSKGFLEVQRQKTQADEQDEFYDLTSWSLPLAMNVESFVTSASVNADARPYERAPQPTFRSGSYGYLIDAMEPNIYRLAGKMLASGVRFSVSAVPVTFGDKSYARGSIVVLRGSNGKDLDATIERLSRETLVSLVWLDSGWTGGTAFGSEDIHYVRDPKIALVGGAGTSSSSYGMLWHTLDVETPVPHTNLSLDSLRNVDLSHYRVLVLPDGDGYADRLGKRGVERLQAWVRAGGTVVAVKGASTFLREKEVELSKIKPWSGPKKKDDEPATDERYNEPRVPGASFRTVMNDRTFLTFGVPRAPFVLIEGSMALLPVSHKVDNVLTIDTQHPLAAGVAWPESLDRLKGAAYLVTEPYGRGQVITFADEPHFRLFWRGTLPLFMNAVLYGPSFPRE